ncbi:hypothetical protein OO016_07175 [Poritiphilus sp. M415]|uniref:Uncharacterized protein n=1 Tax=Lentiprolixibacter aurantiacus TaxID=2993939 RepID=A0AAE3ML91_9FLAO|nr:hypothetical protein [Lentiprolixibacter aurantiacus]MCX2719376.1 hypothetical protein [Lentiprolixibacter aurantiacus]
MREELENPPYPLSRKNGIQMVGVIVDLDTFPRAESFEDFIELLGLRPSAVKVIGYKRDYDTNSPYATPIFSDKDLGWHGEIDNGYAQEFLSREYDVLINYYSEKNLMMQLMTVKTRARIRVGFATVDKTFNDLIVDCPTKDFDLFKNEIRKYLNVLKELSA